MVVDSADDVDILYPKKKVHVGDKARKVHGEGNVVNNSGNKTRRVKKRYYPSSDADRPLVSYLPKPDNGTLIVTSRRRIVASRIASSNSASMIEVGDMEPSEALKLIDKMLDKRSRCTTEEKQNLSERLGYMPLAIVQAIMYINQSTPLLQLSAYLIRWEREKNKERLLKDTDDNIFHEDENDKTTIMTTWNVTFDEIQKHYPSAAELLYFMSLFNPQEIPKLALRCWRRGHTANMVNKVINMRHAIFLVANLVKTVIQLLSYLADPELVLQYLFKILEMFSRRKFDEDEQIDLTLEDELDVDISVLRDYSLVKELRDRDNYLEMHPLVQFCTQRRLYELQGIKLWKSTFLGVLAELFPANEEGKWKLCAELHSHAERALKDPQIDAKDPPDDTQDRSNLAKLCLNLAWYRWRCGSSKTAQELARKAITLKRYCGENDPLVLSSADSNRQSAATLWEMAGSRDPVPEDTCSL